MVPRAELAAVGDQACPVGCGCQAGDWLATHHHPHYQLQPMTSALLIQLLALWPSIRASILSPQLQEMDTMMSILQIRKLSSLEAP